MLRKTMGRKRVEMMKIPKESSRQVTFSKRKSGLFKKTNELCTLTGAEAAIILFSPKNNVFSFGQPHVDTIINRFMNATDPHQPSSIMPLGDPLHNANMNRLNQELMQVLDALDTEKKRGEALKELRKTSQAQNRWESPIEEINSFPHLDRLRSSLEGLRINVKRQKEDTLVRSSNPRQHENGSQVFGINNTETNYLQIFAGSSSSGGIPRFETLIGNDFGFNPNTIHAQVANTSLVVNDTLTTNSPNIFEGCSSSGLFPPFDDLRDDNSGFLNMMSPNFESFLQDPHIASPSQDPAGSSSAIDISPFGGSMLHDFGVNPNMMHTQVSDISQVMEASDIPNPEQLLARTSSSGSIPPFDASEFDPNIMLGEFQDPEFGGK